MKSTYSKVSAIAFAAVVAASAITLMIGQEADAEVRQRANNAAQNALVQANVQVGVEVRDVNVAACVIVGTCPQQQD
jgi:hypothetical protein